jgi:hypothetical protein
MLKRSFILALTALCVLGGSFRARAAVLPLSFEELTKRSKYIVTGEVVELRSYMAPFKGGGECMFTDVKIRIDSVLKGKPAGAEVTVQILGGRIGDAWQVCLEAPRYKQGEKVLAFLREENGKLSNTGWCQGKYPIVQEGQQGQPCARGKGNLPIAGDVPLTTIRDQVRLFSSAEASVPPAGGATVKPQENGKEGDKR